MTDPIVAIIGRPNVGKSTLFNQLAGQRISIVDHRPGVTRDRVYVDIEWLGTKMSLVDTGGIDIDAQDELITSMRRQADVAIDTAQVIIFLVDAKTGITPADEEVANLLRVTQKPIVLGVNKIDAPHEEEMLYEFYNLGIGEPISISASHKRGLGDLLDAVAEHLTHFENREDHGDAIKIAVMGKPNVGKSSIVNNLLGEDRVIVSDMPGTTRDAIDTPFRIDGQGYIIIDTAGIRRKSKIDEDLERYSVIRALAAIRRCDVALMIIDATQGVTEQDTKIAGLIHEEGKGCILVMNKWDLVEKETNTMSQYRRELARDLAFMQYAPSLFTSAHTGQRIHRIIEMVNDVFRQCTFRISTGVLNDCINDAITFTEPPTDKGRRLKIYYGTQVAIKPPTFVLFVNDETLMHFSYLRYLENHFRKSFGLQGTPIRIFVRQRGDQKKGDK